jgi:hypothetical protein
LHGGAYSETLKHPRDAAFMSQALKDLHTFAVEVLCVLMMTLGCTESG